MGLLQCFGLKLCFFPQQNFLLVLTHFFPPLSLESILDSVQYFSCISFPEKATDGSRCHVLLSLLILSQSKYSWLRLLVTSFWSHLKMLMPYNMLGHNNFYSNTKYEHTPLLNMFDSRRWTAVTARSGSVRRPYIVLEVGGHWKMLDNRTTTQKIFFMLASVSSPWAICVYMCTQTS